MGEDNLNPEYARTFPAEQWRTLWRGDDGKQSKSEVHYSPGMIDKCGLCRYFIALNPQWPKGECHKVKGTVDRSYWCMEFARA